MNAPTAGRQRTGADDGRQRTAPDDGRQRTAAHDGRQRIIVAGCGAVGLQLAGVLGAAGALVVVLEIDPLRVAWLRRRMDVGSSLRVEAGDACTPGALEEAGGLRCDSLVACTGSDAENLVICAVAKRHLEVPVVVARVNDHENRWMFDARWGVDVAVPLADALAGPALGAAPRPAG